MNYYQISEDYYLAYGITEGPELSDESIMAGKYVEADALPELIYKINVPDEEECQHFMTGGTLVVSDLFIKTLHSIGVQNFQSFPVLLINPDTSKQRSGYFLFNVLGLIGAADLNSSSYDMLLEGDTEGGISPMVSFDQLSLDKKKLGGLRLFRLAEDPTVIVIDETVKLAMKKNRPKDGWGVMFEELDAE